MFYGSAFNQPINSWDVSRVTTMAVMFMYNNAFNQPLDQWDVSSVTTINSMFVVNSGQFNQDISMWDVSNIKMYSKFIYLWPAGIYTARGIHDAHHHAIDTTHRAPSVVSTNVHNYTMGKTAPD